MIRIQEADFDHSAEYERLRKAADGDGAIVTVTGLVRDYCALGTVTSISLEHYAGMAEKSLMQICSAARERWALGQISVIHRIGELPVSEQIVFVGTTSRHRHDAFAAAEFIMDYLKTQAPFWKKEITSGGPKWVAAKTSDSEAAERWSASSK